MKLHILFEGISDKDSFEVLFAEEMLRLKESGIDVRLSDYGGKFRGYRRRLPREVNAAFEVWGADSVIVHIDSETDTIKKVNTLISDMMTSIDFKFRNKISWVIIQRNLESLLLAGCFSRERNYESIENPTDVVKRFFRRRLNASYKKSIDAKVYLAQLDKRKILSRISGTEEFQNLLTQFHQSQ